MSDLANAADDRLDRQLGIWREWRTPGRMANAHALPPDVADLAATVEAIFDWTDERARSSATGRAPSSDPPSRGGPAGVLQIAEGVQQGLLPQDVAVEAAAELDLIDDDLVFLVAFTAKDPTHGDPEVAGAMMYLAATIADDDALAGRLLRTLAAMSPDRAQQFAHLQHAEVRLSGGADDALRAEVWNELSILLVAAGQADNGYDLAVEARRLALGAGAVATASMAAGNAAFALMQLHRFADARALLVDLAIEQERAGDHANVATTMENIAICDRYLGTG